MIIWRISQEVFMICGMILPLRLALSLIATSRPKTYRNSYLWKHRWALCIQVCAMPVESALFASDLQLSEMFGKTELSTSPLKRVQSQKLTRPNQIARERSMRVARRLGRHIMAAAASIGVTDWAIQQIELALQQPCATGREVFRHGAAAELRQQKANPRK
jgi:hypothetical protein